MKVLMVVPSKDVMGGIASVVNGYRDKGIPGVEIIFVESYVNGSKLAKALKAIKAYAEFRKVLTRNKDIDIIHIHSSFGPSFYRKMPFINMAYRRKLPIINHVHGAEFEKFYTEASNGKKKLIKKIYGRCTKIVALSDEWKEKLSTIVPSENIAIIENYAVIPDMGEIDNSEKILFMGEIGERKGGFDVPKILKELEAKIDDKKIDFTMAGNGQIDEVQKMLQDEGVSTPVVFPGWVRGLNKEKLLRDSGIFLFPSYFEGMPMAILEAMAYGLAIVTTNVGGIPMLISDGETGYLTEPGDTKELAQKLEILINDRYLRNSMGQKAREFVIDKYSYEAHVGKIVKLYHAILKG